MESFRIEDLSFCYPDMETKALDNISVTIRKGEFVIVCGKSGCGKTTLLRLLKPSLSPFGKKEGSIYFNGKPLIDYNAKEQASKIGFVMQSPDNQIVTDKVWHELAFGLESLGYNQSEIRARVSEMASFFGIENWFYKKVTDLSGGQKQLLNLAAIMVMQPAVLILDEPTSQLDPIAAHDFLKTLEKINRELGITVILTEHRLEEAFPMADSVIVLDGGKVIAQANPHEVADILKSTNHDMYRALPAPMRICSAISNSRECPLTVRDGRIWLEEYLKANTVNSDLIPAEAPRIKGSDTVIEVRDAYFRYEKDSPDVIKGLNLKVKKSELFCIVGGNGTGKTTALSLVSGLNTVYRGDIFINGQSIRQIHNLYNGILGVLPQNPQSVFVKKTLYLDLMEILSERKNSKEEKEQKVKDIAALCKIENLLERHPYDLSGGEQQRAALAKILITEPQILLLDEPTKGMDAHFKEEFADILRGLKSNGVTILMVSHDVEFCAEYADRCGLFFDGSITSEGGPREFFAGKSFYTTSANRMARTCLPQAVLADDIILACGKSTEKKENKTPNVTLYKLKDEGEKPKEKKRKPTPAKIILGSIFALLFVLTSIYLQTDIKIFPFEKLSILSSEALQVISIAEIAAALLCFLPQKKAGVLPVQAPKSAGRLSKRTLWASFLILILVPLTIYIGMYFLDDRKYFFVSFAIILETMVPFCMAFESRKPQARELIVISVLCAIAVAGRMALFMVPFLKPVLALIVIAGVCLGGEAGFLVGAITAFVSNFFFGQGPWTPWQMFSFGIVGFFAGILFRKGLIRKTRASLCIYGITATLVLHGGIMNPASVILWQDKITWEMILSSYVMGLPFDLIHALSTAFFLWFISEPMIEKLERIKVKYGLIER